MDNLKLSPASIVILAAGVLMLIGSFLDFYTVPVLSSLNETAWSSGLFGIATVVVLCGIVMAAQVAVENFATGVRLPDRLLGLTWDQVHLALGFQATIMMVAFLIRDKSVLSFGVGFWFMLLAAIALFVGAIMRVTGAGASPPAA